MAGTGASLAGKILSRLTLFPAMVGEVHSLAGKVRGHGGGCLPPWSEIEKVDF
jgi:hypothetical protein